MKRLPEEESLKSAVISIASKIIENDPSENSILHMMRQLSAFGDHIVSRIELNDISARVACASGCSYCCHMQVSVTPPEAFNILAYVLDNFSARQYERVQKRIDNNRHLTEGKNLEERVALKQDTPCIFLTDHVCDIYEARPLICHAWHALNKAACVAAYDSGNFSAEIETAPLRNFIFSTIREALGNICATHNWEYGVYEVPAAMDRCFHSGRPLQDWYERNPVFDDLGLDQK